MLYNNNDWHWFRFPVNVNKRSMGQCSKQISVSVSVFLSQHSLSLTSDEWQRVLWKTDRDRDRDLLRKLAHFTFVYNLYYYEWKAKPMPLHLLICRQNDTLSLSHTNTHSKHSAHRTSALIYTYTHYNWIDKTSEKRTLLARRPCGTVTLTHKFQNSTDAWTRSYTVTGWTN